jgi:aryl-alcohol dehydrogenase-like predicted oxidoreductase
MKSRTFSGGPQVSEVGLGCWQIGGGDWGDVTEEQAEATLRAAFEAGVTFLDTADVYGGGVSEERLGRFRASLPAADRERLFVATKLGRFSEPGWPENFTLAAMRRHTESSLRRLGVDALDLTQLHCVPTDVLREGAVFDHLRTLQSEGKVRRFGASVESMEEALICLEKTGLTSLQIIFSVFRQKPIDTLFEKARASGVALIVRLPLASGLLSGKMGKGTTFAPSDHRSYNRDGQAFNVGETFAGLPFERGVELSEALRPLVPEGTTMADMALRWCLDFDAVTTVIPGAKSPEQARANTRATDLPPLPMPCTRNCAASMRSGSRTTSAGPTDAPGPRPESRRGPFFAR